MITNSNSLFRERDAQSFGRRPTSRHGRARALPRSAVFNQLRILPIVAPHPVQPNSEFSGHGHFGNSFFPAHHQVHIPTSPVRVAPCGCLRCFSQQVAQQFIALLADVPQPLPAATGVLARNEPGVAAKLLATRKPIRRSNDPNVDQPRYGSHAIFSEGFHLSAIAVYRDLGVDAARPALSARPAAKLLDRRGRPTIRPRSPSSRRSPWKNPLGLSR